MIFLELMKATASMAQEPISPLSSKVVEAPAGIFPPTASYTRESISAASWRLTSWLGPKVLAVVELPFTMPRSRAHMMYSYIAVPVSTSVKGSFSV